MLDINNEYFRQCIYFLVAVWLIDLIGWKKSRIYQLELELVSAFLVLIKYQIMVQLHFSSRNYQSNLPIIKQNYPKIVRKYPLCKQIISSVDK